MNIDYKKSVTFFFPYYQVSGVPILFLRFATKLAELGKTVYIVDFENGYMQKKTKHNKKINFIRYEKKKKLSFPKNSTIVMQSILPQTIPNNLHFDESNKIVFWTLLQTNFIQTIIPIDFIKNFQYSSPFFFRIFANTILRSYTKRLNLMLEKMHTKNALLFQSQDAFDFTNRMLHLHFPNPVLMPVCIEDNSNNDISIDRIQDKINILWIGRLDDFKIHILNFFIKHLNSSKHLDSYNIKLTIVGSGQYLYKTPKKKHTRLTIEHFKKVDHDKLHKFFKNTHIFAGMGTSALEAASYGIPTILLDFSFKKITFSYPFKWIYEKKQYDLGSFIRKKDFSKNINNNLDDMILEVIKNPQIISQKMRNHFLQNHSLNNFITTFDRHLDNSRFYYKDFDKKLFRKSIVRKIYEVFRKNIW